MKAIINQRIREFMNSLEISDNQFAKRLRNTIVIVLLRAWISHGWKTLKRGWQRQ